MTRGIFPSLMPEVINRFRRGNAFAGENERRLSTARPPRRLCGVCGRRSARTRSPRVYLERHRNHSSPARVPAALPLPSSPPAPFYSFFFSFTSEGHAAVHFHCIRFPRCLVLGAAYFKRLPLLALPFHARDRSPASSGINGSVVKSPPRESAAEKKDRPRFRSRSVFS